MKQSTGEKGMDWSITDTVCLFYQDKAQRPRGGNIFSNEKENETHLEEKEIERK